MLWLMTWVSLDCVKTCPVLASVTTIQAFSEMMFHWAYYAWHLVPTKRTKQFSWAWYKMLNETFLTSCANQKKKFPIVVHNIKWFLLPCMGTDNPVMSGHHDYSETKDIFQNGQMFWRWYILRAQTFVNLCMIWLCGWESVNEQGLLEISEKVIK